jgi:hypothetical protein
MYSRIKQVGEIGHLLNLEWILVINVAGDVLLWNFEVHFRRAA